MDPDSPAAGCECGRCGHARQTGTSDFGMLAVGHRAARSRGPPAAVVTRDVASRRLTKPVVDSYSAVERISAYVAGVALGTAFAVAVILLAFAVTPIF